MEYGGWNRGGVVSIPLTLTNPESSEDNVDRELDRDLDGRESSEVDDSGTGEDDSPPPQADQEFDELVERTMKEEIPDSEISTDEETDSMEEVSESVFAIIEEESIEEETMDEQNN